MDGRGGKEGKGGNRRSGDWGVAPSLKFMDLLVLSINMNNCMSSGIELSVAHVHCSWLFLHVYYIVLVVELKSSDDVISHAKHHIFHSPLMCCHFSNTFYGRNLFVKING